MEIDQAVVFIVTKHEAPEHFKENAETFWIYLAQHATLTGVIYQAWGTDVKEAVTKTADLIEVDAANGITREPGELVQ